MKRAPLRALPLLVVCLSAALLLFFVAALPLGGGLSLLTPLPVAFCYYRGRPLGLIVAMAGTLLVSLPAGPDSRVVAFLFLEMAAAGVVLGEALRQGWGPEAAVGLERWSLRLPPRPSSPPTRRSCTGSPSSWPRPTRPR